jgi:hypothetical protein
MENIFTKTVFCGYLNKETNVDYYIKDLRITPSGITKRTIDHYNCASRALCDGCFDLSKCASLREMKRTEAEIKLGL